MFRNLEWSVTLIATKHSSLSSNAKGQLSSSNMVETGTTSFMNLNAQTSVSVKLALRIMKLAKVTFHKMLNTNLSLILLDFLMEMRQIFEGNTFDSIPSMPLETDSYVFEFLSSCNNDVKLAKTRMYSLLSFGKGTTYLFHRKRVDLY